MSATWEQGSVPWKCRIGGFRPHRLFARQGQGQPIGPALSGFVAGGPDLDLARGGCGEAQAAVVRAARRRIVVIVLAQTAGAAHQQVGIEGRGRESDLVGLSGANRDGPGVGVFAAVEGVVAAPQLALNGLAGANRARLLLGGGDSRGRTARAGQGQAGGRLDQDGQGRGGGKQGSEHEKSPNASSLPNGGRLSPSAGIAVRNRKIVALPP